MLPWVLCTHLSGGLPEGGEVGPYHTALHNRIILMFINRQINMDYSLCKVLSYNMEGMPLALISMTSCASMESISRKEQRKVQDCPFLTLWSSGQGLGSSTSMAIRTPACPAFLQAMFLGPSRLMGRSLRHCGHPSTTSHGASGGCPWHITKRFWMHI